jgi:hypothetical protein
MHIVNGRKVRAAAVALVLTVVGTATPKYSGGTGEPNDPYQIATAADLIALGEIPEDYDKHFVLTADLDLDPNLPGGRVFGKAVIAPMAKPAAVWEARPPNPPFAGVLDGGGHTISHLTITGDDYLGLFGQLASGAEVRNLALADVNIVGSSGYVGGLVALSGGRIRASYVTGQVHGEFVVGGLAGDTGGLITACYAQVRVSGTLSVGGFVGSADGTIVHCYAAGEVLPAEGSGSFGGFTGEEGTRGSIQGCLWDTEVSGIRVSGCAIGFDTAALMEPNAYSLNGWAGDPNWVLDGGRDYPRLAWEGRPGQAIGEPVIDFLAGSGMPEDPYQIATAGQLARLGTASILWDKALALTADLDVNGIEIRRIGICSGSDFRGSFDGRGHTIRNLTLDASDQCVRYLGLFGWIHSQGRVSNLNLERAVIQGEGERIAGLGALAAFNEGILSNCTATNVWVGGQPPDEEMSALLGGLVGENRGSIDHCRVSGNVGGGYHIGGLVGLNYGSIAHCRADAAVYGRLSLTGGLVGSNVWTSIRAHDGTLLVYQGVIKNSCATGQVTGAEKAYDMGGLVGSNLGGDIVGCYATGAVSGRRRVGGLAGYNGGTLINSYARGDVAGQNTAGGLAAMNAGTVTACYATGAVTGDENLGGLVGLNSFGDISRSFWDIRTSGLAGSAGGTGRTTAELQMVQTFLAAGWDFVGETTSGTEGTWWIEEGKDYPRLWWEAGDGASP